MKKYFSIGGSLLSYLFLREYLIKLSMLIELELSKTEIVDIDCLNNSTFGRILEPFKIEKY